MAVVEELTKTTLEEIEKVLSARTVVGEPTTIEGRTMIPLISVGFAFGAGGGSGRSEMKQKGEGEGGGTGGGAWVRPVALVIIDKDGVKVESVRGAFSSVVERLGDTVPKVVEKIVEAWEQRRKEG
jgi:uncharacterized spore protein YtfJ